MFGDSDRDLRSKSSETKRSVVELRVFRSDIQASMLDLKNLESLIICMKFWMYKVNNVGDWSNGMIGVSKTFGGSSILSSPAFSIDLNACKYRCFGLFLFYKKESWKISRIVFLGIKKCIIINVSYNRRLRNSCDGVLRLGWPGGGLLRWH